MQNAFSADDMIVASALAINLRVATNAPPVFDKLKYAQTLIDPVLAAMPSDKIPLVKGADGALYLAYVGDNGVVVARQDGAAWQTMSHAYFGEGREVQLVTNAQGVPYLMVLRAIFDQVQQDYINVISVLSLQGGAWQTVGTEDWLSVQNPMSPRLAIGTDGTPSLSYYDPNANELVLRNFVGGVWTSAGQGATPGLSGNPYELQISADGKPYVAFIDGADNSRVKVMSVDSGTWSVVANPQRVDVPVSKIAFAASANGLYMAYGDGNTDLYVQFFDGTNWTSLASPRGDGTLGTSALPYGLTVGSDGAAYLTASQTRMDNNFYVMRYADGAWKPISTSIDGARNTAIVMGDNGKVYVTAASSQTGAAVMYQIDPIAQATAVTTGTAVTLTTHDPNGDTLSYSIVGGTHQSLFEVTAGGIRFIDKPTAAGTYSVQVSLDDGVNQVTRTVSVTVTVPPNSAPQLDTSFAHKLADTLLGGQLPVGAVGVQVSVMLGNSVTDIDGNPVGLAVTGVNGGTLHYSVDGGTTWVAVTDPVSASHALGLRADARIYFEAASGSTGTVGNALSFRAWDGSDGATGKWLDLSGRIETQASILGAGAADITTFGTLAFEATATGLKVYDPTQPGVVVGTVLVPQTIGVAAGDSFAYAVSQTGQTLSVISLATPSTPAVVQNVDLSGYMQQPMGVAAYGNTVLVASGDAGVYAFTVDANGVPTVMGNSIPASLPTSLALDSTRYVIGNGTTGLMLVDRSSNRMTELNFGGYAGAVSANARDVVIQGDYAFVASGGGGLLIANIADLSAPQWVTRVTLAGQSERLAVVGDRVFVITSGSVQVIDVGNIAQPVVGTPIAIARGTGITVVGQTLVITTDDALNVVSSGVLPSSVSQASDTASVDIRETLAPPVTPPVTSPSIPTTPIDGVPVEISTGSDGQQQIRIPVVGNDRQEDTSTANSKLADITLVKNTAGTSLLNLGVPAGVGLTANGPATPVAGNAAQTVLDGRIDAAAGTTEQKSAAQAFLSSLAAGTPVVVQTVTVSAQAPNGGPLVVSAGNVQDGHKTALVIDTRALPAGATINLSNVDFAIIVGNARVIGGAGANVVYGNSLDQFIVLGEGDDVLHGGGGQDTVGSLRGNDQTFGDDGDDIVYGGTGNDILHGGKGNDRMNGGFGFDTGVQSGVLSDYTVTVDGRSVVLTNKSNGEFDRFLDVEHIAFASGTSLIVAYEPGDVAGLRARFADAQLIELNANRAVSGTDARDDITPELGMALNIDLGAGIDIVRLAGARVDVHIDVEAGQRAELTRLADGAMLAFNQVEMLAFANGNVTVLAHNHQEAVVGRAYELLLGRNVDTGGYTFWLSGMQAGVSLKDTLSSMMKTPEFTGASLSNSAFVDLVYTNGFARTADAGGKAFWVGALDAGASRAQVLEGIASSAEAVTVIGSTIDVTVVS